VYYVAEDAKKRVNAAFLIGAYSVRLLLCLLIKHTDVIFDDVTLFVISAFLTIFGSKGRLKVV